MSAGPTDWVSGERVFAPPGGTLDADWLVPALLEKVPSADPPSARAALAVAWAAYRSGQPAPTQDDLSRAAAEVLTEAVSLFHADPSETSPA